MGLKKLCVNNVEKKDKMGILKRLFGRKKNVIKRKKEPDVHMIVDENDRMNWAMEKSRLTLHYFKDCLQNPKNGQDYFSIKAKIQDGNIIEHIWIGEPNFDSEGNIYGIIGNKPLDVENVSMGEKIGITFNDVSDWMIIENGKLIGGYTIRAIRDEIPKSKLKSFDLSLGGMYIDEGEDYFLPNHETPEGAILSLEEAYDNEDLEKAISCKDFRKEAELMLQKTVSIEIDDEIIDNTAEVLKFAFIKDREDNGFPKFEGIKRAFRRHKISEEHFIITEICHYPDGGKSKEKLNTYKTNNIWKVGSLEE